jgi:hypothetical protein
VSQAIVFASICPRCNREQVQDGFTVADLMRLLYGGYPIEAYCVSCDQFWPVNLRKRVELGEVVAATWGGALPLKEGDHPTPHSSEDKLGF